MPLFAVLKANFEENNDSLASDADKFVGKWRLINTEEDEIPDTTEAPDNSADYETYEFLSNGTYYHVVEDDNTSGDWEINSSMLVLIVDDPFGVLSFSYGYIFSDDVHRFTLNLSENPGDFLEFEKVSAV